MSILTSAQVAGVTRRAGTAYIDADAGTALRDGVAQARREAADARQASEATVKEAMALLNGCTALVVRGSRVPLLAVSERRNAWRVKDADALTAALVAAGLDPADYIERTVSPVLRTV